MKHITLVLFAAIAATAHAGDENKLTLKAGERNVLTYNTAFIPSPDAKAPWFGRSGFIHPVLSPKGRIVTDAFPSDHLHQHALMFAWTSARIDGRKVDFWNSKKQEGRVEHAETVKTDKDVIVVKLRHIDLTADKPTAVLNETWEIRLVSDETKDDVNVFDLVSTQHAIGPKPFTLAKYHYGGMCIRGAMSWRGEKVMLTSEGKDRIKGNHSRPNWVAMHGLVDDHPCGIAAMGHPKNFRAPQPVRLHPEMPYFCFAPMVLDGFEIKPGEPYVSRYRFVTFDGKTDPERLDKIWKAYAK